MVEARLASMVGPYGLAPRGYAIGHNHIDYGMLWWY